MNRCRRCHRILKDSESIRVGYGPACYKKVLESRPSSERTKKSPFSRQSRVKSKAKCKSEPGPLFVAHGLDELTQLLENIEEVD